MQLSVCIDALFRGQDFIQGVQTVKEAGIDTIEFWGWWDKDLESIRSAKDRLGMKIAACCTRFVSLVNPKLQEEYLAGLRETIAVAQRLGCDRIISQVGNTVPGLSREVQHQTLVAGLKRCVPLLEKSGITLLVEPLNTIVNHQEYYLYSSEEAFQIIAAVNSQQVKVLYDIYHQQIMEGNLITRISQNIGAIGHFHAAGNPGRHELTHGEINYPEVLRAIARTGYSGYVVLEYYPLEDPARGIREILSWL